MCIRDSHTAEHIVKAFYPPHAIRAFVHSKMQRDTQKHLLRCFQPVSYTHLDVYKRQAIVDAAKNAQTTQAVQFNGSSEDLKLNVVYGAAHLSLIHISRKVFLLCPTT